MGRFDVFRWVAPVRNQAPQDLGRDAARGLVSFHSGRTVRSGVGRSRDGERGTNNAALHVSDVVAHVDQQGMI